MSPWRRGVIAGSQQQREATRQRDHGELLQGMLCKKWSPAYSSCWESGEEQGSKMLARENVIPFKREREARLASVIQSNLNIPSFVKLVIVVHRQEDYGTKRKQRKQRLRD